MPDCLIHQLLAASLISCGYLLVKILMMTNTYLPHVGGVARSIAQFTEQFRARGHVVRIVAPEFDGMPANEPDVIRIPAIRNFNHTDFSVIQPIPHPLMSALAGFTPDIVHTHHPFLIGNIALRIAHNLEVPLVFTHHTKYEDYTHNLFLDGKVVKRFAINLATRYSNLCDQVISPSESMKKILIERGVTSTIDSVSTGVSDDFFGSDSDGNFRTWLGIPDDAFVVGHLGRITKEKNIDVLITAAIQFIKAALSSNSSTYKKYCFALFGDGPELSRVEEMFNKAGLSECYFKTGVLDRVDVPKAYRTMDVFLFSSLSETQGMVLTEAMASAKPVVAIDAPGVTDVVQDRVNGRMVARNKQEELSEALQWVVSRDTATYQKLREASLATAEKFTMKNSCNRMLNFYQSRIDENPMQRPESFTNWSQILHTVESEWTLLVNTLAAARESLTD